jgi:hypothetical protein
VSTPVSAAISAGRYCHARQIMVRIAPLPVVGAGRDVVLLERHVIDNDVRARTDRRPAFATPSARLLVA